tara:strand:+ start:128 stop:490 length:363 start_codon:yes stop_codon:yes gene_type:complete
MSKKEEGPSLKIDSASDKVTVEIIHTEKGLPGQGLIALLIILLFTAGMAYYYVNFENENSPDSFEESSVKGNCGDGIDNDGGGQSDSDDPDCYSNPQVWEGYNPNRNEVDSTNDPPEGKP